MHVWQGSLGHRVSDAVATGRSTLVMYVGQQVLGVVDVCKVAIQHSTLTLFPCTGYRTFRRPTLARWADDAFMVHAGNAGQNGATGPRGNDGNNGAQGPQGGWAVAVVLLGLTCSVL